MEIAFLRDGRKVSVNSSVTGGFIVTPYYVATIWGSGGDEEQEWEGLAKEPIFVDEIFASAPTEILDEQVVLLQSAISAKNHEINEQKKALQSLRYEIDCVKNEKTRLEKFIINRNEILQAKRICFFEEGQINPIDSKKPAKDMKLSFSISIADGKISISGHKLLYGDEWSGSYRIDSKQGILIDLTDDELLLIAKERAASITSDYAIQMASDIYLSEIQSQRKNEILQKKKESTIEEKKKQLAVITAELAKLQE